MKDKDSDLLKQMHFENHNENCSVNQGVFNGSVFALPGSNPIVNNYYGKQHRQTAEDDNSGLENEDDRNKRKSDALHKICELFNFTDKQLGMYGNGKKITNETVRRIFRMSFGFGGYPPSEYKHTIEIMWSLLIDQRNQCAKQSGEDYFRQTVLNIVGYFRFKKIVLGQPRDLARSVFPDADSNIAKNIDRGVSSPVFPKEVTKILDIFINKVMAEEL